MGYSEGRGDSLNLVNNQFNDGPPALPMWRDPEMIACSRPSWPGCWAIVAFWLYRKVRRQVTDYLYPPVDPVAESERIEAQREARKWPAPKPRATRTTWNAPARWRTRIRVPSPWSCTWMSKDENDSAKPMDGMTRSAVLMMSLGEDAAAEVFKYLTAREVQQVGAAIASLKQVAQ